MYMYIPYFLDQMPRLLLPRFCAASIRWGRLFEDGVYSLAAAGMGIQVPMRQLWLSRANLWRLTSRPTHLVDDLEASAVPSLGSHADRIIYIHAVERKHTYASALGV